jgi:hypothetical protein
MIEIKTEIFIMSSTTDVWNRLTDFNSYSSWNHFITNLTGKMAIGEKLSVTICPPGKKPTTFTPTIIILQINKELRWVGNLFFDWVFRGEHYFQLEQIKGGTRFIHGEIFSGFLAPILLKFIKEPTRLGFILMNSCLNKVINSNISLKLNDVNEISI